MRRPTRSWVRTVRGLESAGVSDVTVLLERVIRPVALLATSRRRDRPENVRDDGGTSRAMLKRTLAICRPLPTDVPASLAASVKAAINAFLNQRLGANPRARLPRGGFFLPVRAPSDHGCGRSGAVLAICVRRPSDHQLHNFVPGRPGTLSGAIGSHMWEKPERRRTSNGVGVAICLKNWDSTSNCRFPSRLR